MPGWYLQYRGVLMILQALIGVMIFGYALKRRSHFVLRAFCGTLVSCAISHVVGSLFYLRGTTPLAMLSHAGVTVMAYGLIIATVYFCLEESIWTAMFTASSGYIAQDLAGSFKQAVKQIPIMGALAEQDVGILLVDLLCYGSVYLLLFFAFRSATRNREDNFDNKLKAIVSVVVLVICIGMARLTQDNPGRNMTAAVAESVYSILLDILMLVLQFGLMERARLNNTVDTMQELMHQQYMQYETSRESVELINEKYHDLKSLLGSIGPLVPGEQVQQLKQSIERYDMRIRSGFEVLDVLLAQKMDLCIQRNINLTVNLGQADLSFMEEMDLYALFQNALNNAINAEMELPEGVFRYILLMVRQTGNVITIHVENPCPEDIAFQDGLPQTRNDPRYHGFGMKSMERTAEKYDGTLAVKTEHGKFYLDIIMLAPEKAS